MRILKLGMEESLRTLNISAASQSERQWNSIQVQHDDCESACQQKLPESTVRAEQVHPQHRGELGHW